MNSINHMFLVSGNKEPYEKKISSLKDDAKKLTSEINQSKLDCSQIEKNCDDLFHSIIEDNEIETPSLETKSLSVIEQEILNLASKKEELVDKENELETKYDEIGLLTSLNNLEKSSVEIDQGINYFEVLTDNMLKIAKNEGTTLLTGLTTAAAGTLGVFYVNGITATALGLGAIAISTNEFYKIFKRHLDDIGAEDHLKIIDHALNNLVLRNHEAKESIQKADSYLKKTTDKIEELDSQRKNLQTLIESHDETLKKYVEASLDQIETLINQLNTQKDNIEKAKDLGMNSLSILEKQMDLLKNLHQKEFTLKTEDDVVKTIKLIKEEINSIFAMSKEAYEYQKKSSDFLYEALESTSNVNKLTDQLCYLIGEIEVARLELENAGNIIQEMQTNIEKTNLNTKGLENELGRLKTISENQTFDLKIAKDQLDAKKRTEHIDPDTAILGSMSAASIGMAGGYLIGGTTLALGGTFIGLIGFGPFAIKSVMYARKILNAKKEIDVKDQMNALNRLSRSLIERANGVTVDANYGYSQGNLIGASGLKSIWNLGGQLINKMYGDTLVSEWKSEVAGVVTCHIGTLTIPIAFNKTNPEMKNYGAIPLQTQQELAKVLKNGLNSKFPPEMVLDLLKQLEEVRIGNESVVMIKKTSNAMAALKKECVDLLNKVN